MNVLQTNVSLARTPEVAAVMALQVGQADLFQRESAVNAARDAAHKQDLVAGTEAGVETAGVDGERGGRSREEKRPPAQRVPEQQAPAAPAGRSFSPAGVGTRLDLVV